MAEDRFQKLKEKYVSVLSVINREDIRVQNIHVENDKLLIRGEAPSEQAKNNFWDAVKKVNADFDKDFVGQITVKAQTAKAKAPATPPPGLSPVAGKKEAEREVVETYTVVKGDTLSEIAQKFYGNANEYMRIFEANRDQLKDPDKIQVGQKLKIPAKGVSKEA